MSDEHKLNIHVDGNRVFERVYSTYVDMMNAARFERDSIAAKYPNGFIVAQSQKLGPHGWAHLAILS